ncbi:glycosyltransferase [Algoriphagus persicinus]|uniref:glycosyltransferase n=1 Tax=Algoriphagus persicinus TaxID=3108754 RepID=UPI002B3FB1AC|nr:glycosyltransferase [Algoriphagus sp. E1-3-M2]MEB2784734.1 glycosyltransferase [Algoriphagus sp. E1-3-M2]
MKSEPILFIAHSGPFPNRDGKRQRTFAILQALSAKYQVDFLIINNRHDFHVAEENLHLDKVKFLHCSSENSRWQGIQHKLGFVFIHSKKLTYHIRNLCEQKKYAFIFSRYIQPVSHIPFGQKIIADIDDDFDEQYQSRIRNATGLYSKLRLLQIYNFNRVYYRRLLGKLNLAITVKDDTSLPKSILLPNLPFQLMLDNSIEFRENRSDSILFVGKLTYEPNLEGILWFIKKVFPLIQKSIPGATLTVVSNLDTPKDEFLELARANSSIQVIINAGNLSEIYFAHAIAIAPIFQGAGSNIKVIEGLMMGRPVVTTNFGAKGFENIVKEGLLFCEDSAEDFSGKVIELLEKKEGLFDIQKRAFDSFQENYSLQKWNEKLLVEIERELTPDRLEEPINRK